LLARRGFHQNTRVQEYGFAKQKKVMIPIILMILPTSSIPFQFQALNYFESRRPGVLLLLVDGRVLSFNKWMGLQALL
jgi:hypothetical protein